MEFELENLVTHLSENIPSASKDNRRLALQTKELCSSIKDALATASSLDSSHIISILLSSHNGILFFLSKLEKSQESMFSETIRVILEILELILTKFGGKAQDSLVYLKDAAIKYLHAKEALLRKLAYKILILIVDAAAHGVSDEVIQKLKLQALLNQMFTSLGQSSFDNATSVKKNFFILLGHLARHFPQLVQDRAGRIVKHVMRELGKEVNGSYEKMEHTLIIGYVEALSGLLDGFHSSDTIISSDELEKLHNLLLEVVFRGLSGKKRDSSRAALTVALSHSALFNKWFLGSYKKWFECLKFYSLHKNPEDTKIGTKMFSKFMGEISRELSSKAPGSFPEKSEIVEFLVRNMFEILESIEASTKLKMLAMKALGELSRSVSPANALLIFDYISKKAIYLCLQEDVPKNVLAIYPVCLESIGMFLSQHGSTTMRSEQLNQLQKICIQVFSRFLDIAEKKQYLCGRAVVVFLIGVWSSLENSINFTKFIGETVTQGLVRSSRPELRADELKKYSSFWSDVMNFSRHADLPLTLEAHVSVTQALDEQLIASLSNIIKRLNFDVEEGEKTIEAEENEYELVPKNVNDWQLLENLVDLLNDIAEAVEPKERLVNYLIPLGAKVMAASHQHPHVLGFYRLLALVLQVVGDKMQLSDQKSYQDFIKALITRLPQMSTNSLMSSVQAILASPAWLVNAIRDSISSALVSALKVGLTNPKLADWPLKALKQWQISLNPSDFEEIMVEIVPQLELYLHSYAQREKDVYLIGGNRMKKHIPLDVESWNRTQREVLKLLGDLGPFSSRLAIKDEDEIISRVGTEWRTGRDLNLKLPLNDIEASISIDAFLPNVIHLVYHSSDAKVRLAACEFLHAACVFLIGKTSQQREEYKSHHLYSKLFPTILDLSIDADATVRVLFENLLAQIVHWFSRPSFYSKDLTGRETILGTEAGLLVDVLMETVCSEDDTSLARDVAANSLKEFLDWAIKQSSDSILRANPAVPEFIFQKLRALAVHPSPKQRLGAAMICCKICNSLHRCEPLMSLFTLDLFAHFLVSLSLADKDLAEVGTQERCESAVCRLGRIIYLNKNTFSKPDAHRRTAPLLVKGTIEEINELLMRHFFSELSRTRRLSITICRALLRPESVVTYVKDFLKKFHLDSFLSNASFQTTLDVCRLMLHHNVIDAADCKDIDPFKTKYHNFLQSLSASLENLTTQDDEYPSIVLTWMDFLTEYSSKAKDYSLLPVDLVVRTLLQPSYLGFPPNALKPRQDFYDRFQKLCPSIKKHRQAVLSTVSLFKFDPHSTNFNDASTLDLLHGLSLLASFELLDLLTLKLNSPSVLLKAAIDPLIAKCKTGECSQQIKASSWLLETAIQLGLGMDLLAAELKDPSSISGTPFIKGQYVRAKLGTSLWAVILEQPRYILPFCPELGNGDPQQWDLLNELMLAALQLKKTWVADRLLDSWTVLVEHAKSYNEMSRFRSFVNTLMHLDLRKVGESAVVKRWIIDSWYDPNADVNFAKESAQLLKIFAVNCTPSEENDVVNALNKFFSSHFASKTADLRTDLEKSDYFSVFNLLLDVINSPPVCYFLIEVFSLEPQHPRAASFTQWMNNWMKGAPAPFLNRLFERLNQRATMLTVPPIIRIQAVECLYVPLLSAAPTTAIDIHFQSALQEFTQASKESLASSESIVKRTVLCSILPVFITRLGYQALVSKHNASYCSLENITANADGKNLLRSITKFALDTRKLTTPPSGVDADLFERMHGSVFKLIQSVASISALDESSVDKLVFKPLTPALWNAIVGTTKEYTLTAQVDRGKKQFLVHLPTTSDDTESNYGYAPSQYLYASSLSEDVYRFDFNHASVTSQTTYVGSKSSIPRIEQEENITSFNLSLNELNQHHVMAPLVAFLREQGDKTLKSYEQAREPPWMATLRETLAHPNVHRNVVLFIVRLALNLEPLFRTFAQSWYNPLLMVLLRRIGGEPLNSLFRDGLEMILDWCKENLPEATDKEFIKLASSVVEFVAKNVTRGETEVVKDNKEMFRAMLNVWEGLPLEMPLKLVSEMLDSSRSNQIIALLLLDAMANHGFLPNTDSEWGNSLKNRLIDLLSDSEKRDVLRTTAFVCGSMLARHSDADFETRIVEELVKFHTKGKPDVFTDALFEITRHHTSILRLARFPYLNLNLLSNLHGTLKARCIEILSESWRYMEDPWKEIGRRTFEDILKKTNPAELTPALKLLTSLIPRLELEEWLPLWGRLTRIAQHENVACRSKLYELFKKAFDIAPSKAEFAKALLRACGDRDQELASSVQNFLSEKLPNTAVDRILAYLKQFYSPANEGQFLPYFSYFVLERTTKSPRYREPIFDQPLADVPFEVLDLSSLSSQIRTQSFRGAGSFLFPGTLRGGFLRATQQPTYQTLGTQGATNWLMSETQSQSPLESSRLQQSPTKTRSSLAIPSSPVKSWKRFADGSAPPSSEKRSSYSYRRKVEASVAKQPTIYRRYRTGELPDVQIPLSALLAPLQALALLDPLIAKSLFCCLLSAIGEKVKEVQGDNQDFVARLGDLLKDLLYIAEEQGSSPNIISAIFEYLWSSGTQLEVEAEKLHSAAKKHHRRQLGILVLEELLPTETSKDDGAKQPKKLKMSIGQTQSPSDWFLVADSYADLDDIDSARATVIHLTGCEETTMRAIECEMARDWEGACSYYSRSLSSPTSTDREESFCKEFQFKCLEILGEWGEIKHLQPDIEPWSTRSFLREALQSKELELAKQLDFSSLTSIDIALYPELAALALKIGRKDQAAYYINKAIDDFFVRYSLPSPLDFRGRRTLLERVCLLTEIHNFLDDFVSSRHFSLPKPGDNTLLWDSILNIRNSLKNLADSELLSSHLTILPLDIAAVAIEQKNFVYARKLLENALNIPESKVARHRLLLGKIYAMQQLRRKDPGRKLENFIRAKTTINQTRNLNDPRDQLDLANFESELCFEVARLGEENPIALESKRSHVEEVWDVPIGEIIQNGKRHLRRCTEMCESIHSNCDAGNAYYVMARYIHKSRSQMPADEFYGEFTSSVMKSMKLGSKDGTSLFLLLIVMVKDSPIAQETFVKELDQVPLNAFLTFVNQLVSHCASAPVFEPLLIRMAKEYPINVRLPLQISRPNFESLGQEDIVKRVESQLPEDVALEMFLKSLDYLRPPEIVASEVVYGAGKLVDFEIFKEKYLNLPPPSKSSPHGNIHFKFSEAFSGKFEKAFQEESFDDLKEALAALKKTTRPGVAHSLLEYSPWIANYRFGEELSGKLWLPVSKGRTLRVESVRDDIRFFASKQFPVKLTFIIDGAKEFSVLVKHGEDVRQDERIIQLLDVIDTAILRDEDCRRRNLRIRTFQVVPLTIKCGMFEWVEGTVPLKAFLESDHKFKSSLKRLNEERAKIFTRKGSYYYLRAPQEQLNLDYERMASLTYPHGLGGALKRLSQSAEAYFYLRQRFACSHGTHCSALWILGIGDRHLSNTLVSIKTGDLIPIDYGMAFGTATSGLPVPELAPCRLTNQFQKLIPGLGLNGPIRESMVHTLRVARKEIETLLAALAVFVTEPTLDWSTHAKTLIEDQEPGASAGESPISWSRKEVIERTERILRGAHPAAITTQDLHRNPTYMSKENRNSLAFISAILGGEFVEEQKITEESTKRKAIGDANTRSIVLRGLEADEQVEQLIRQSTNNMVLSRMYHGWEPWV